MFAGKLTVPKCWLFVAFNPLSALILILICLTFDIKKCNCHFLFTVPMIYIVNNVVSIVELAVNDTTEVDF